MKRTTKDVGLDVHQAITVGLVREATEQVIARTVVPTEATALLAFVRDIRGAVHVVRGGDASPMAPRPPRSGRGPSPFRCAVDWRMADGFHKKRRLPPPGCREGTTGG
jgi:hypothetical protein